MCSRSVAVLLSALGLVADSPKLAADLQAGMTLIDSSNGTAQPPWCVESAEAGAPLEDDADCARVRIRRQPASPPDDSRLCGDDRMRHGWDAARNTWVAQRPVGPGMALTINRPNGDIVRYVTGDEHDEAVGAFHVRVIDTTVTTTDAAGRPLRRLRERYALTLTTATGGRFDVPDPNDPTGWQTQQAFELTEIRPVR